MAPSVTLGVSATREGAMPEPLLPHTCVLLLTAFQPCFSAPTYRHFTVLVAGWIHGLGRNRSVSLSCRSRDGGELPRNAASPAA